MILLPLLVLAAAGYAVYALAHRHHLATAHAAVVVAPHRPFWPTTILGWAAISAFGGIVLSGLLVNVVLVQYLAWALAMAVLMCSLLARYASHDRSVSVLALAVLSSIMILASLAFVAGELFIGHD